MGLVHGGRDYFKKHAKTGVWKFRIRETKLAGHTHAVVSAFDRSDKYGDTEIGSFSFKIEDLVTGSVSNIGGNSAYFTRRATTRFFLDNHLQNCDFLEIFLLFPL